MMHRSPPGPLRAAVLAAVLALAAGCAGPPPFAPDAAATGQPVDPGPPDPRIVPLSQELEDQALR